MFEQVFEKINPFDFIESAFPIFLYRILAIVGASFQFVDTRSRNE